jgi:hypothetical protein
MNTAEVKAALRARFCAPEWAIFFEVADGTGGNHNRWADAVAMNMWPSRGLAIHGFEIKVSRSDWLRELKKPEKSGPVQQYCDRWWIVTPKGIVKREELPPTWGLYEVSEAGAFRQVVEAPKLEPIPVTRDFMAAILRRASGIDAEAMAAAVSKEVVRQRAGDHARVTAEIERKRIAYVKRFQTSSALAACRLQDGDKARRSPMR